MLCFAWNRSSPNTQWGVTPLMDSWMGHPNDVWKNSFVYQTYELSGVQWLTSKIMTIKVSWDVHFGGFLASWTKVADELLATNLAKRGASTQLVTTLCISAEKGQTREEREWERERDENLENRYLPIYGIWCHFTKWDGVINMCVLQCFTHCLSAGVPLLAGGAELLVLERCSEDKSEVLASFLCSTFLNVFDTEIITSDHHKDGLSTFYIYIICLYNCIPYGFM